MAARHLRLRPTWEIGMPHSNDFAARLAAVRSSEVIDELRSTSGYRNGQLLESSDDVSQWDNFDRYFKFYSIYVDEESYNRT